MSLRLWFRASYGDQRHRKSPAKLGGRNFDIRKNLLEYDDVANDQRKVVYAQRDSLLTTNDVGETITDFCTEVVNTLINQFVAPESLGEQWDVKGLAGEQSLRAFEKHILLRILDDKWKEHLSIMDHLRQGIHLCSYAAKNPKQEYKQEAFELLSQMLFEIKHKAIANKILHVVAVAIFNKQGDLLIAQRPKRTDLYRTCLSRKNNSARVWIIKDFHGEAHGRERQAKP